MNMSATLIWPRTAISASTPTSKGIRKNPIFVPIVAVCVTSLFILLLVIAYVYRSRISASSIRNNTGTTGHHNQIRKRSFWERWFTSAPTPLHISHPVPVMQEDDSNNPYHVNQDASTSLEKAISPPNIHLSAIAIDVREERAAVATVHIAEDRYTPNTTLETPKERRTTLRNSAVHPAESERKSLAAVATIVSTIGHPSAPQSSTLSPHQASAALMARRRQRSRTLDSAALKRSASTRTILIHNDTKTRPPSSYDDNDIRMSVYPTTPSDPGHVTLTRAATPVQTRRGTWAASRARE
jgi:hypothetical protein